MGVGLGERPEALVGVPDVVVDGSRTRRRARRRDERALGDRLSADGSCRRASTRSSELARRRVGRRRRARLAASAGELATSSERLDRAGRPDPEVAEVGVALGVEQHVRGADVAVRDALAVCERERRRDLFDDAQRAVGLERVASRLDGRQASPRR